MAACARGCGSDGGRGVIEVLLRVSKAVEGPYRRHSGEEEGEEVVEEEEDEDEDEEEKGTQNMGMSVEILKHTTSREL